MIIDEFVQMQKKQLEELGLLTPESEKPEWLWGVDGSSPTPKAEWVPANKDGNPEAG